MVKKVDTIFRRAPRFAVQEARMVVYNVNFQKHVGIGLGTIALMVLFCLSIFGSSFLNIKTARAANTCTWTGATNANWSNAGNWSTCGGVAPTSADTVSFTSGSVASTVDTAYTVAALTVNGYTGTITLGANLTVSGAYSQSTATVDLGTNTFSISGDASFTSGMIKNGAVSVSSGATNTTTFSHGFTFGTSQASPDVTLNTSSGHLYFNGSTFNLTGTCVLDKIAGSGAQDLSNINSGGNIFNGAVTIEDSAASGENLVMSFTDTNGYYDTFNAPITFTNTGASVLHAGYNGTGHQFNQNITVNSTGTGAIFFGGTGSQNSTSVLASGVTITAGTFTSGTLSLRGVTQSASTNQNLTLSGTATLSLGTLTNLNGNTLSFTAPTIQLSGSTFNGGTATFNQTSNTTQGLGSGNNTFNSTTMTNVNKQGTANFVLGFTSGESDVFNGPVTFDNSTSSGGLYIQYYSGTTTFAKSVVFSGIVQTGIGGGTVDFTAGIGVTQTLNTGGNLSASINNMHHSGTGILQLAANTPTITSLDNQAGILDANGYNITATTFTNEATLKLKGSETVSTPTNNTGSLVQYYGTAGPYNVQNWTYYNLQFSSASATTYNLIATSTVNGNVTLDANNALDTSASNWGITAGGNMTINGTLTGNGSTITVSGNWDSSGGTFNYGTSVVNLTGTGSLKTPGVIEVPYFYNLNAAAVGKTTTLQSHMGASNVLTLGTGTLSGPTYDVTVTGIGTPFVNNGASMSLYYFLYYPASAGTVTVSGGDYGGLTLYLAPQVTGATFQLGGILNMGGLMYFYNSSAMASVFNSQNYSITTNGFRLGSNNSFTVNLGSSTVNLGSWGLDVMAGAHTLNLGSATINTSGANWQLVYGTGSITQNPGTSLVTFDGTLGTQTITSGGSSFYNLTHSGAGTLQLSTNNLSVGGTFTNSAGIFNSNGLTNAVAGLTTVSGGTYSASTNTQNLNGGLTISGGTFTGSGGAVNVAGDLNISSGTFTAPSGNLTITGNFTNNGTFANNSGTVTFNGASILAGSAVPPAFAATFNNLTVNAGKTVKFTNGEYFKIVGALNLLGTSVSHVTVNSSDNTNQWYVNYQPGSAAISYADVSNSGCDSTNSPVTANLNLDATNTNVTNDGYCWFQPYLSFAMDSNAITFNNLNNANNYTDTQAVTFTTSTNAKHGYVIQGFMSDFLRALADPTQIISDFGGTWAAPALWGNTCVSGGASYCGFGYTSSDTSVQGSNRFAGGTAYAAYSQTGPGDVLADHGDISSEVKNEQFTITNKVSVPATQAASKYQATLTVIVTSTY